MKKRILSLALASAMAVGTVSGAFAETEVATKTNVPYIQGNQDGEFMPNADVTRQEIAVMVGKALELKGTNPDFKDSAKIASWASEFVAGLQDAEIVEGDDAGNFNPTNKISRAELATMIVRAYEKSTGETLSEGDASFKDLTGKEWYASAVKKAANAGLVKGDGTGNFNATGNASRAQTVVMVNRMLGLEGAEGASELTTSLKDSDEWPSWAKEAILIASTPFEYTVGEDGKIVIILKVSVDSVSVATAEDVATVSAVVKNAEAGAKATVEIYANGDTTAAPAATKEVEIVDGKVSAEFAGLPAGDHVARVKVGEASKDANFTITISELAVQSVSAINANQIKVTFSKEVDKASAETASNYTLKVNGANFAPANSLSAKLQSDNKTVILSDVSATTNLYATYGAILASGNSYQVIVENVLDTNYKSMEKYTGEVKAFLDSEAPTVTKAEYKNGVVKVYFNEPVNPATVDWKVDGGALNSNGAGLTSKIDKEEYTLEFTPNSDQKTVGNHTVTLYEVDDALGNRAAVLSAPYTVEADTTAPSVVSITPDGMYTFKVKFSESLSPALATGNVTIKKGALTLTTSAVTVDANDSTIYKVTVADKDADNKVFATGESSVALSVNIKGYSDPAGLAGAEYNGSVTLAKDTTPPTVVNPGLNKGLNTNVLQVTFNEDLDTAYGTAGTVNDKVVVKKDGVIISTATASTVVNDASGNPRVVNIPLGVAISSGTYTVEFSADAVRDMAGNKNTAIATTVAYSDSTALIAPTITTPSTNVFNVAFASGVDMTDSAVTLSNYKLDGVALPAGTTIGFYGDKKAVRITLPSGSVANSSTGLLSISKNVVNTNGVRVLASANPDVEAVGTVTLTDNVRPSLSEAKYLVNASTDTTTSKVKVKFNENLAAVSNTNDFINDIKVVVNGVKQTVTAISDVTAGDRYVTLTLANAVNVNQTATVSIVAEADQVAPGATTISITDVAGNKATENSSTTTSGTELDSDAVAQAAAVAADKAVLNVTTTGGEAITAAKTDLVLATSGANGSTITWDATANAAVTNAGVVTRAAYNPASTAGADDVTGNIVATITKGFASDTKTFAVTVKSLLPAATGTANAGTIDLATGAVDIGATAIVVNDDEGNAINGLTLANFTIGAVSNLTGDLVGKTVDFTGNSLDQIAGLATTETGTFDVVLTDAAANSITVTVTVTQQ